VAYSYTNSDNKQSYFNSVHCIAVYTGPCWNCLSKLASQRKYSSIESHSSIIDITAQVKKLLNLPENVLS